MSRARTGRNQGNGGRAGKALALSLLLATVLLGTSAGEAEARKYPKIFGSIELPSKNLKKFPKWLDMVGRWKNGAPCESDTCTAKGWQGLVDNLKGKDRLTQIKEVNKLLNSKKYIIDMKNWGLEDYWATPYQFLRKNGDCEDYAIAKFMVLKELGVPIEDMRVVALQDLNLGVGHAVLVVYDGDDPLLLDNQIKSVVPANTVKHYQPVYSINEKGWWLHRK
ncbi:transglutaminase-like cysteine peptidase [Dongia sp.]|uniref:transglutaminase-like cysteine peptidase n=1 Tax=Dongia sp. TaxID=1977262 RepID=UPI0035B0395F